MGERTLLQQWFDGGGTIEGLDQQYGIKCRRGRERTNLISCKYDQIDSEKVRAHPLVREARGIVLDEGDGYRVVARAFDRFFNVEDEAAADPIDWSTAIVMDKVDGSCMTVFWHQGRWLVASSGTPDASGECHGWGITFADLFWRTASEVGLELPDQDPGVCFTFELTSPLTRIVVQHERSDLTLLGARDLRTQVELTARDAASIYLPSAKVVREYPFRSFADIAKALDTLNPLEGEGFVVCDGRFNRVKAKSKAYVLLHRAKDGCNPRSLMEIARQGEASEVEGAFPELKATLDDYRARIEAWTEEVDAHYIQLRDISEQKQFALQAVKTPCPSALFTIRKGGAKNARDYLKSVHIDRVMEWLDVKSVPASPTGHT